MIPATVTARQISLVCRANHTALTGLTDDINIPTTMRNALVWFIASRVWGSRKDDQASNKRYLCICNNTYLLVSYFVIRVLALQWI